VVDLEELGLGLSEDLGWIDDEDADFVPDELASDEEDLVAVEFGLLDAE